MGGLFGSLIASWFSFRRLTPVRKTWDLVQTTILLYAMYYLAQMTSASGQEWHDLESVLGLLVTIAIVLTLIFDEAMDALIEVSILGLMQSTASWQRENYFLAPY